MVEDEIVDQTNEAEVVENDMANADPAVARLTERLAQAEQQAAGSAEALRQRDEAAARLSQRLSEAVSRYRELALRQAPEVPPELVRGETIEEVDSSLNAAHELVARIRSKMEAEVASKVAAEWVPSGSSQRAQADASNLSAFEKIARGLGRAG